MGENFNTARITEFILGLIGGIFGVLSSILAMFVGSIDAVFTGSTTVSSLGVSALFASIVGIIGSVVVKKRDKLGGILMIVSAIWGIISISLFYILSFVLLLMAGLMGVFRKG
ncbi:DUF4064 domain-containing protein [Salirhabdus sp. Marseille-P4669]|uniref:DUF4064 domain-containing protein n=1 Tax=Salirhabdus sp. Marseille-P4669 TaxID=2042310 RepID=UPI000C7C887E|nr:DUF4064 domain-containing protein [Salirhabdus sp. Marseille-P4669]